MRKALFPLVLSALLFTTYSCKDDQDEKDGGPSSANPVGMVENPHSSGQTVSADFMGRISDKSGAPLANAMVSIGDFVTTSDANGFYRAENVQVDDQYALIQVESNGMFTQYRALKPSSARTNFEDITMIPRIFNGFFSTSEGGTVTVPGGGKVIFPAGTLVTSSGATYSGEVLVASTYLDPSDPDLSSYMPGSLLAVNEEGEATGMETYGMFGVEIYAANTQEPLQLADGREATLEMNVPSNHLSEAPAEIPLWYFDETAGIWHEEGSATLVGDQYIGTVKHFSFWNCDVNLPLVILEGQVLKSPSGSVMTNVQVKLTRSNGNSGFAYPGAEGYFQGQIPVDETFTLEVVTYSCGEEVMLYEGGQIGPFSEDTDIGVINVDLSQIPLDMIEFEGSVVDCDGTPLEEIVVEFDFSESTAVSYVYTDENGEWSISIPCLTEGELELALLDLEAFTENDDYSIAYNADLSIAYDAGSLVYCDGELIPTLLTYTDAENVLEYDQVEFSPVLEECSPLTATVLGDATNSFVQGLEIQQLDSDTSGFFFCYEEDVVIKGYSPTGEYVVVSSIAPGGVEGWVQVNQFYETADGTLLDAIVYLYGMEAEVYEDETESVLINTYQPEQGSQVSFQIVY